MGNFNVSKVDSLWREGEIEDSLKAVQKIAKEEEEWENIPSALKNAFKLTLEGAGTSIGLPVPNLGKGEDEGSGGFSLEDAKEYAASSGIVDKLAPAVAIGIGNVLEGRNFKWPEGWGAKTRKLGTKGVAYILAVRANKLVRDFTKEELGMTGGASSTAGGLAAYGTYKGAQSIVTNALGNIKVGMAGEVIEEAIEEGAKSTVKALTEKHAAGKLTHSALKKGTDNAKKVASEKVVKVMKERLGDQASKRWDDAAMRLMKPNIAMRVGSLLKKAGLHKKALKLAASATAFIVPEGVSTAIGALGIGLTAWDLFELSQQWPELHALIFETPEEGAEEKPDIESQIIDEMTEEESIFGGGVGTPSPRQEFY